MTATQEEVSPQTIVKSPINIGERGLSLRSLDDMWRFANYLSRSGLAPKGIETPEAILIAVQMGLELGLTPMAALQNIAVINGRPAVWGDAQLAVCRASAAWMESGFKEEWAGEGDDLHCAVTVQRKGGNPCVRTFSVRDAKTANLWGKQGPWSQYPKRMLQMRARSYALRDTFGDVLRGFHSVEEVRDGNLKEVEGNVVEAAPAKTLAEKIKAKTAGKVEGSASEGKAAASSRKTADDAMASQAGVESESRDERGGEDRMASPSAPDADPTDLLNALGDLAKTKVPSFATVEEARQVVGQARFDEAMKDAGFVEADVPKLKPPQIRTLIANIITVVKQS